MHGLQASDRMVVPDQHSQLLGYRDVLAFRVIDDRPFQMRKFRDRLTKQCETHADIDVPDEVSKVLNVEWNPASRIDCEVTNEQK